MKKIKILPLILILCLVFTTYNPDAFALDDPRLKSADSVILVDMYTGEIVYEKEPNMEHSIASLTKVMTCLLAVEAVEDGRVKLSDTVEAQEDCLQGLDVSSSNAGIKPGEVMTYKDLLFCALVHSANDACNVLATYIEGSISKFVVKMNQRAQEIGCKNTHFIDTDGMLNRSEGHYSTAYDLSLITREAMSHKLFVEVCSTVDYEVSPTNYRDAFEIHNTNALVSADGLYGDSYLYDGVIGVKTGFTKPAGYCLISTCKRDDKYFLAVVLGCNGVLTYTVVGEYQNFQDSATLYDWAFQNFSYKDVFLAGEPLTRVEIENAKDNQTVALGPDRSIQLLMPNDITDDKINIDIQLYDDKLVAPVTEGDVLGRAEVYFDGEYYTTVDMLAKTSIELDKAAARKQKIHNFFSSGWVKGILIGVPACIVLFIAISAFLKYRRRQQLKVRMEAMERRKRAQAAQQSSAQRARQGNPQSAQRQAAQQGTRRSENPQRESVSRQNAYDRDEDELRRKQAAAAAARRRAQAAQRQSAQKAVNPNSIPNSTSQRRQPQQSATAERRENGQPSQTPRQQAPQVREKSVEEMDLDELIRSLGVDFKDI